MRGSTYNPSKISDFEATKLNFLGYGQSVACAASTTTQADVFLNDDFLLSGGSCIVKGAAHGDHIAMQVIDIDNVLGYGANTMLKSFITNWYVAEGSSSFLLEVPYPAKILGGLYIRITYTSTGLTPVNFAVNFLLHKVLI